VGLPLTGSVRRGRAIRLTRLGASGLPGLYQVVWGEDRVCVRGGCSGAGDGDERERVGGDPVPGALERYEVVVVELACLQPLDRAEEQQLIGDGFPVSADDVDLDVVAARPVAPITGAAGMSQAGSRRASASRTSGSTGRPRQWVQLRLIRASVGSERIRSTSARCRQSETARRQMTADNGPGQRRGSPGPV
jgi:hypothetical protein